MNEKTLGQLRLQTPVITGMAMLETEQAGLVDIVTFADGRVLVIACDGIELWPNERELMNADPEGDFPAMIGFIEYRAGPRLPGLQPRQRGYSRRFGNMTRKFHGALIVNFEKGVLYLEDGYHLNLREGEISLWCDGDAWSDDTDDGRFGNRGVITWEVEA